MASQPASSSCPVSATDWAGPCISVVLKYGSVALLHPVDYAKTLIQIGHEPIAPVPTKTFLGRPALVFPNVIRYIRLIKQRDGLCGLYAGLAPRLINLGITSHVEEAFGAWWPQEPQKSVDWRHISDEEVKDRVINQIRRDACLKLTLTFVTQPLHVIAVRTMAQFVGGEAKYNGILEPFREILRENGILGFWAGFIPRALGEVLFVCFASGLALTLNRYILDDVSLMQYSGHAASYIASTLVYPFTVVSNCMAVASSGLMAGYPPNMPFYMNSLECYRHLKSHDQLKRGSSLLMRYYTGPQVIVGDRVMPVNSNAFQFAK